jgi:hypothetical protein
LSEKISTLVGLKIACEDKSEGRTGKEKINFISSCAKKFFFCAFTFSSLFLD